MSSKDQFDEIVNYLVTQFTSESSSILHSSMFKSALFKKFMESYENGWCTDTDSDVAIMTGDKLRDSAVTKLCTTVEISPSLERSLEGVVVMWDEWRYALDNHKQRFH